MPPAVVWFFHVPLVHNAAVGFASAAAVDIHALMKGNGWKAFKDYDWSVASWRWFVGTLTGAFGGWLVGG